MIDSFGIEKTWAKILRSFDEKKPILELESFGDYYEIGLAYVNKHDKKSSGKYYTPKDVSSLLASFSTGMEYETVADVGCGTGNLILAFLDYIGEEKANYLLDNNKIYLYDMDYLALSICIKSIEIKYKKKGINCIAGDFLRKTTYIPEKCLVISNPPYGSFKEIDSKWETSENLKKSKDLYSAFMEKIIKKVDNAIIITPFSFIGGKQFYELRKIMNNYGGQIYAFDNVPSSIFNRKKHGIFNSNTSNSVRTAITIVKKDEKGKGFQVTPLLRFNAEERDKLIHKDILKEYIGNKYQKVSDENQMYYKCFNELLPIFEAYLKNSNRTFSELISKEKTEFKMDISTSGRYYLGGASKGLNRTGKETFYFNNERDFVFAYAFVNSSFAYFYWRIYDGNITYPKSLLMSAKIFDNKINTVEYLKLKQIVEEMISKENEFLVYKKNAGKMQENIKFPIEYRDKLNKILLELIGIEEKNSKLFNIVHSSNLFEPEN